MLQSMGLSNIPVGNSDAGAYFNNMVLEAVDFGVCLIRFFFAVPSFRLFLDYPTDGQ